MTLTRRDLIRGGLAAAACASVPWSLERARADATAAHLLIVLNYGGWDTTYSLDPKPGLPRVDAPEGELRRFGDLPVWTHESRPSVDRFFERWGELTALVHGVQVRSFVHSDCIKRVMTGSPSETTPDMGAIAAFERGRDLPVPYLALGAQARSGQLASITGRTGTTNQLIALVDPEAAYATPASAYLPDPGLQPTEAESALVGAYLAAGAARLRATRGQRGYNAARVEDFERSLQRASRLAGFASEGTDLGAREYTLDIAVQIPLAVRALREGLSHTALLQSGFDWDTHDGNAQQSAYHEGLFAALDGLCGELESNGLLDSTLVLVLSEMGRTPMLNDQMGKDHWPVTSCMLLGSGVRGGRVLGGTSDELGALSMDLATGELDPGGKQLQASNLVAGVLESLGVDPEPYLPATEPFRGFRA